MLDNNLIEDLEVEKKWLDKEIRAQRLEVSRRMKKFRAGLPSLKLILSNRVPRKLKTVVLVDDGIATGATVKAAVKYLKTKKLKRIVLAAPIAPRDTAERFQSMVDECVILETPDFFHAVGQFYKDFPQVSDAEVIQLLQK